MTEDVVETLLAQWRTVRPDLDASAMRTSGRLLRAAKLVEKRLEVVLAEHGLGIWQFDVLATLRRHDTELSPKQLMGATMLSSGAMTNRLDRLEAEGWIERRPDPDDRRGVRVQLTETGRRKVDAAIESRFAEARAVEAVLESPQREALAALLTVLERGLSAVAND